MRLLSDVYLIGSGEIGLSNTYDSHIYLIDGGDDAVIIDTGVGLSTEIILKNAKKHVDLDKISRILLTHSHADHAGGARDFQEIGKKVFISDVEAHMLQNCKEDIEEALELAKNAQAYPPDYRYRFFTPDGTIEDEEIIKVGKYEILAIHMKGHSPGLLCYYLKTEDTNVLFTGDQVFINGAIGLLNAPGSSLKEYRESIKRIGKLQVDALLPGHRLFVLKNGQSHIEKAIENLSKVFVPLTF